ncbi:MAG: hypothetical protein ETSY1_08425 [Candidatus Entotheonella factor]|uniref:Uncharacterized protein n=1 Tax=Entotheonella factor TaxID=1429438 RepID=W4LT70_ENTF1|nr:MAG: hypothetical protein ETSY1_08425 [Candidatus Entotheonella factor]
MQPSATSSQTSSRQRYGLPRPTLRFLAIVALIWGLYVGYGYLSGPARRTDRLNAALARKPATVNLLITSKFPPEEFHIRLYQQVGNMRGVEGNTAKLYGVSPHKARALSRYYWIEQIDLAAETK